MAHIVTDKLQRDILPWMLTARRLPKKYRPYEFYKYAHDLLAMAASYGIGHPLTMALSSGTSKGLAGELINSGPLAVPLGVVAALAWGVLKVTVAHNDGEKRATLAGSCVREFRKLENRLFFELAKTEPMPGLVEIQRDMQVIVDRNIAEGSWSFVPIIPYDIDPEANDEALRLATKFGSLWISATDQNARMAVVAQAPSHSAGGDPS